MDVLLALMLFACGAPQKRAARMVSSADMTRFLPAVAFFSGVSGIAYEVLYARLIGGYLGSMFYVSAVLLAVFFVGIALGSFWSYRFLRKLPHIEILIGMYAIGAAIFFNIVGLSIIPIVSGLPLPGVYDIALFVALFVIVPAIAIGFSVPLFARYLEQYRLQREGFTLTYVLYNLGAALSVIAVEFLLVRHFGISAGLLLFGTLNICIGVYLWFVPAPEENDKERVALSTRTNPNTGLLFYVSVASGVLQATVLGLYELIIGPLSGNFAFLIAAVLLGVSLSALLVARLRLSFAAVLLGSCVTMLLVFGFLHYFILSYAYILERLSQIIEPSHTGFVWRSIFFPIITLVPVFAFIGATVPALVRATTEKAAGWFLGIAAMGNALGYLLYTFLLYERLPVQLMIFFIAGVFLVAYIVSSQKQRAHEYAPAMATFGLLGLCLVILWPAYLGKLSHWDTLTYDVVSRHEEKIRNSKEFKRFSSTVYVVEDTSGDTYILHHGNVGVGLPGQRTDRTVREAFLGALGAFYTTERERALVIGLGAGTTASAAADAYDEVVVAEVHPAMYDASLQLQKENDDIWSKENVTLVVEDGLVATLKDDTQYDVVVNSVSSPKYYTAGKLWSKDFYVEVEKHLKPEGVFIGWVDAKITETAVHVIDNTLKTTFAHCVYHHLNNKYLAFVCGNRVLTPTQPADFTEGFLVDLLTENGWREDMYTLVYYTALDITPTMQTKEINTIDRPLLEYNTFLVDDMDDSLDFFSEYTARGGLDPFTDTHKVRSLYCMAMDFINTLAVCDKR